MKKINMIILGITGTVVLVFLVVYGINNLDIFNRSRDNKKITSNETTEKKGKTVVIEDKEDENKKDEIVSNNIRIYYGDEDEKLSEKSFIVPEGTDKKEELIFNKIKNSSDKLKNVKLIWVKTEDKICNLNLSKDFKTALQGTIGESIIIYSIVNSLTELDFIEKVQFYIEDEKGFETGHNTYYEPIEKNTDILNK
ncbi:MAG: GerMN domain-containing protein [Clostridiales bacterium]